MNIYLAKNLRFLRELKGWSRNEMASILDKPPVLIGEWENGKQEPDTAALVHISQHFRFTIDQLITKDLGGKIADVKNKQIKLLVMDIDGVLTDGGMYYTEAGDEFKKFNTKDGMAIKSLQSRGVLTGIISSGYNYKLIKKRAELLGVQHVYAGDERKLNVIQSWCKEHNYNASEIAYIGDDINDIEVMQFVGIAACPADAVDRVKNYCHVVLSREGGQGCVREFVDNYIYAL